MAESVAPGAFRAEESCAPKRQGRRPLVSSATPAELERQRRRALVYEHFNRLGMTVRQWALENGYKPKTVYKVLGGESKGLYGDSHDIAVKLGIKDGIVGANHA